MIYEIALYWYENNTFAILVRFTDGKWYLSDVLPSDYNEMVTYCNYLKEENFNTVHRTYESYLSINHGDYNELVKITEDFIYPDNHNGVRSIMAFYFKDGIPC